MPSGLRRWSPGGGGGWYLPSLTSPSSCPPCLVLKAHTALVTALDYDANTGWMVSAADDGVVAVFRETSKVRSLFLSH